MTLSDEARSLRLSGSQDRAREVTTQALALELEAAERIPKTPESEPTRSILYRSAAALAYKAGDFQTAQRLVFEALSGYPSPRVEQELKDLYEQLNLTAHLRVRGAELGEGQMQMALVGEDVGSGVVAYTAFEDRVRALIAMIDRTMHRLMGEAYRRASRGSYRSRPFTPFISAPRAGSFAVTILVAQRTDLLAPVRTSSDEVIDQVIGGIDMVQERRFEDLGVLIGDEKYFVNFVSLAQRLAPDGKRIKIVGLTSLRNEVSFTTPRTTIPIPYESGYIGSPALSPREGLQTHRGILGEARARNGGDTIELKVDGSDRSIDARVREGLDDLVRLSVDRHVEVNIAHRGGSRTLQAIGEIDEE
jgi:hypothetical protein